MKKIIPLVILWVFVLFSCEKKGSRTYEYEWKDISIPMDVSLQSICMLNEQVGYVGGSSFINYTKSIYHLGGGQFGDTLIYAPDNGIFYSEYEFEADQDPNPVLYKTSNGGSSWQEIETPFKIGIREMQFIDEFKGYVISEHEGVYKTTDGGTSWTKILGDMIHYYYGPVADAFHHLCFIDEKNGFVYDADATESINLLFSTHDGGESWECLSIEYPGGITGTHPTLFNNLNKVIGFNSSDTAYLINNNTQLYKTVDLGEHWKKIFSGSINAGSVYFASPQVGYLADEHLMTRDGGATWSADNSWIRGEDVVLIDNKEFYYLYYGKIMKYIVGESSNYVMTKERNEYMHDLSFPSDKVGYAVGDYGTVLKYLRK